MWTKWIAGNTPQAQERMRTMVKSMMIRRTKDQKSKVTSPKDFFLILQADLF